MSTSHYSKDTAYHFNDFDEQNKGYIRRKQDVSGSKLFDSGGTLLLIDDQAPRIDQNIVDMFTIYSHHLNITCVLLTQSIFCSKKEYRTISLNSHYIVLMKNTRDASSVTNLAKQTHPYR